jgi:formylglycine-generating enzyme required for sulfatase activity
MDRQILRVELTTAQAHLAAERDAALGASGLPSGLAYLALPLLGLLQAHDDQDEIADLLKELVGADHRRTLRAAIAGDLEIALRALDGDSPLGQACKALLEAITEPNQRTALDTQMQMVVGAGGTIANSQIVNVQAGGHFHAAPSDPAVAQQQRALLTYLGRTSTECNALPLSQLDPTDAAQRAMELARVYIGLHTTTQTPLSEVELRQLSQTDARRAGERPTRPLTALEAFAHSDENRLMLLGKPGSGKSTLLSHLALCLAGAALLECSSDAQQPQNEWLARLPGWTRGVLLPVRIVLRDFAAYAPLATAPRGSLRLLLEFLAATLADAGCANAIEPLTAALEEGRAILLLDGLDEVVGQPVLARVTESIADAATTYAHSPIAVTCRVLDYQTEKQRQLAGFTVQTLADLIDIQIDQFVADWYAELAASGRRTPAIARADTQALQQALATRPELRDLARLPLLLTVMALVHTNRGTLPDARALLYAECIKLLLLRWRQPHGEHDLLARLNLPQFRSGDLLALMARLGFAAHEVAERRVTPEARPADLSKLEIMRLLSEGFAQYDNERSFALAELVFNSLERGNGLLLKRGPDAYAFPHRTFQELLAGYHLKSQRDYRKLCLARAQEPHWHEALSLMVGYQALADRELEKPLGLVEKLLDRSAEERVLAGELLNLIGRERAAQYDAEVAAPGGLWSQARDKLLAIATQGHAPEAPAPLRVRAGLVAGTLCYGDLATLSQPDARLALPDERLPLAALGLPAQSDDWWKPALDAYWRPIEASDFWYGDDRKKQPLQRVELPYAFKIARFPLSNADFARFVAADGYNSDQPWWTAQGRIFLAPGGHPYDDQEQPIALPCFWNRPDCNNTLQPLVGVSWYEAAAYCAWLTRQGHAQGWLPEDAEVRLPTALEWQRAARHTDQRPYPWDVAADVECANYNAGALNQASPVGCYPLGAAVCSALDLAGNVWEWTASLWEKYTVFEPRKGFTSTPLETPVICGGSFADLA